MGAGAADIAGHAHLNDASTGEADADLSAIEEHPVAARDGITHRGEAFAPDRDLAEQLEVDITVGVNDRAGRHVLDGIGPDANGELVARSEHVGGRDGFGGDDSTDLAGFAGRTFGVDDGSAGLGGAARVGGGRGLLPGDRRLRRDGCEYAHADRSRAAKRSAAVSGSSGSGSSSGSATSSTSSSSSPTAGSRGTAPPWSAGVRCASPAPSPEAGGRLAPVWADAGPTARQTVTHRRARSSSFVLSTVQTPFGWQPPKRRSSTGEQRRF